MAASAPHVRVPESGVVWARHFIRLVMRLAAAANLRSLNELRPPRAPNPDGSFKFRWFLGMFLVWRPRTVEAGRNTLCLLRPPLISMGSPASCRVTLKKS